MNDERELGKTALQVGSCGMLAKSLVAPELDP